MKFLKFLGILALAAILSVSLISCDYDVAPFGQKIMNRIDELADELNECVIDINELTDFEWDVMIAVELDFFVKYSDEEIKNMFGTELENVNGNKSRLFFLKDNEVVFTESYSASIEESLKFNIITGSSGYSVVMSDNAEISARREFFTGAFDTHTKKNTWKYYLLF